MGRHSGGRNTRLGWVVAALAALVVGGAGITYAVTRGGDAAPMSASADRTSLSPSGSATTDGAAASASTTAASSVTSTSSNDAGAAALASCAQATTTGDAMAKAAANSARDWGIHTQAELDNEAGKITYAQAEVRWKDSKSRSRQDVAGFRQADTGWSSAKGQCGDVAKATQGTPSEQAGARCAERVAALNAVQSKGRAVNDEWAEHVVMMAGKAHTDHAEYHKRWVAMVHAAGPTLAAYETAAQQLASAPSCG